MCSNWFIVCILVFVYFRLGPIFLWKRHNFFDADTFCHPTVWAKVDNWHMIHWSQYCVDWTLSDIVDTTVLVSVHSRRQNAYKIMCDCFVIEKQKQYWAIWCAACMVCIGLKWQIRRPWCRIISRAWWLCSRLSYIYVWSGIGRTAYTSDAFAICHGHEYFGYDYEYFSCRFLTCLQYYVFSWLKGALDILTANRESVQVGGGWGSR